MKWACRIAVSLLLFASAPKALANEACEAGYQHLADSSEIGELLAQKKWQEAAWHALENGDKAKASELENQLENLLNHAPVTAPMTYAESGSSEVYKVNLDGVDAIFKPNLKFWKRRARAFHDWDMPDKEVAAYVFDRAAGGHLVPVTVKRTIDGVEGSLQAFVSMDEKIHVYSETQSAYRNEDRLAVLDYMMHTHDRSPNNRPAMQGSPVAIDNAMTFLKESPHRAHGIQTPPRLESIQDLEKYGPALASFKDMDLDAIRSALTGKIGPEELDAALARAATVKELGQRFSLHGAGN